MTTKERVLRYLLTGNPLDPLTAWRRLGVYRLGARIYDLRREGWRIKTRRKEVITRSSERAIVAEYVLETEKEAA